MPPFNTAVLGRVNTPVFETWGSITRVTEHSIGGRMKAVREKHGWSQTVLAKKCGVSQSTIGNLEAGINSGEDSPNLPTFAEVLGVSLKWLKTGHGPQSAAPAQISPEALEIALGLDRLTGKAREKALAICRLEVLSDEMPAETPDAELDLPPAAPPKRRHAAQK